MDTNNIIASAVSTCVAEIATIPICTIKTNYQNKNTSIYNVIKNISKNGIQQYYMSSPWALLSQIVSTTSKYTFYEKLKTYIDNKFLSGTISGFLSSIFTHPIDVIKIHKQMGEKIDHYHKKTLYFYYRGYSKTFFKSTIGSTFFFPIYDIIYDNIKNVQASALFSAVISTIILQPIDYMKTTQIYNNKKIISEKKLNISLCQLYKGLSLNLFRVVPHFLITMTLLEYIKNLQIVNL